MFIDQLHSVEDLGEGQRALPEPGTTYELRTMANEAIGAGQVTHVVRHGKALYAITTGGQSHPITGHGSPVLVPVRR